MRSVSLLRGLGNTLYEHAFPVYRPLYRCFKIYADRAERRLLRKVLFPGAVVVDAGANIGVYSQFLSRFVGSTGIVHSFEPSPESFQRLRAATRTLSNVRASQAAVGERTGNAELYVSDELNVDHRTYLTNGCSRRAVPIHMVALDNYFQPGERVDLIKLDIQGYELHALRGASRVVEENPEIKLLLELWPYGMRQAGAHWRDLIATLENKGMSVRQVGTAGLIPFQSSSASCATENADWYVNLFASRHVMIQL